MLLGNRSRVSTMDPKGAWFDGWLVDQAEAVWRAKFHKPPAKRWPAPTSQDAVRAMCREIPADELTAAERAKLMPSIAAMSAKAQRLVVSIAKRSAAAFRPPPSEYTATEIPPPRPRPSHVEIPPEQVMASLQRLEGGD